MIDRVHPINRDERRAVVAMHGLAGGYKVAVLVALLLQFPSDSVAAGVYRPANSRRENDWPSVNDSMGSHALLLRRYNDDRLFMEAL